MIVWECVGKEKRLYVRSKVGQQELVGYNPTGFALSRLGMTGVQRTKVISYTYNACVCCIRFTPRLFPTNIELQIHIYIQLYNHGCMHITYLHSNIILQIIIILPLLLFFVVAIK